MLLQESHKRTKLYNCNTYASFPGQCHAGFLVVTSVSVNHYEPRPGDCVSPPLIALSPPGFHIPFSSSLTGFPNQTLGGYGVSWAAGGLQDDRKTSSLNFVQLPHQVTMVSSSSSHTSACLSICFPSPACCLLSYSGFGATALAKPFCLLDCFLCSSLLSRECYLLSPLPRPL